MDSNTAVLAAIVALTVAEVAAVVVVALFGHGETQALVGTLVGIVGPVVATFIAVWNSVAARKEVAAMRSVLPPAAPAASTPEKPS